MPVEDTTYEWLPCFPPKLLICNIRSKEITPFWVAFFNCPPSLQQNWIHLRYCKVLSISKWMRSSPHSITCQCLQRGTKITVQESHKPWWGKVEWVEKWNGWKRACDIKLLSSRAQMLPMFAIHKGWKDPEEEASCWNEKRDSMVVLIIHPLN